MYVDLHCRQKGLYICYMDRYMSMYMYMYMYSCMYVHIIIYSDTNIYIHTCFHIHKYIHPYMHTHMNTHIYTHMSNTIKLCMNVNKNTKRIISPVLHYIALGLSYGVPIVMSADVRRQRIYDNLSLPRICIDDCLLLCIYTSTPLSPPGHTGGQVCVRPASDPPLSVPAQAHRVL